jgi:PIN like domain
MKHFYLDENLSEYVAQSLNLLNKGYFNNVAVHSTKETFGKGVADEEIIPEIGHAGGFMITKDINIKRRQLQFELCKNHGIGIFFLIMPKGLDKHWEIVKTLVIHWEAILKITDLQKRPFAFEIKMRGGLKKLN